MNPVVAVGLDVTRKTLLTEADLAALAQRCAGLPRAPALLRFLQDSARYYFDLMEKRYGARRLSLYFAPSATSVA